MGPLRVSSSYLSVLVLTFFVFFALFLFLRSRWSFVDVPLIFSCPADHVPEWQPRMLINVDEARSVNLKNTKTHALLIHTNSWCGKRQAHKMWSMVIPEKAAPVIGTTSSTTGPVPVDSRQ